MFFDVHTHGRGLHSIHNLNIGVAEEINSQYFSAGIHPWHITTSKLETELALIQQLALQEYCLAFGEAGLDKQCDTPWDVQLHAFQKQISLANQFTKPLLIHCVKAHQEIIQLHKQATSPWILHGFNQKETISNLVLPTSLCISFGRALLNKESNASQFIGRVPIERVFLETDDADISIEEIYRAASERLDLPMAYLEGKLQANFERIFKGR